MIIIVALTVCTLMNLIGKSADRRGDDPGEGDGGKGLPHSHPSDITFPGGNKEREDDEKTDRDGERERASIRPSRECRIQKRTEHPSRYDKGEKTQKAEDDTDIQECFPLLRRENLERASFRV